MLDFLSSNVTVLTTVITGVVSALAGYFAFRNKSRELLDKAYNAHFDRLEKRLCELEKSHEVVCEKLRTMQSEWERMNAVLNEVGRFKRHVVESLSQTMEHLKVRPPEIDDALKKIRYTQSVLEDLESVIKWKD